MSLLAARMLLCGDPGKTPPLFGAVPSGPVVEVSLSMPELGGREDCACGQSLGTEAGREAQPFFVGHGWYYVTGDCAITARTPGAVFWDIL